MHAHPWYVAGALALACGAAWPQAAPEAAETAFGTPVASERLAQLRGGTDTTNNDVRLTGTTSGNTAIDVQSGTNSISSGAFANVAGIPVVIQNSGANVLIQNSLILNLQVR